MPVIKHEYPVLEYDTEKTAVVMPNRKNKFQLPSKCVYGFLGDSVEKFALEHNLDVIAEYRSMMKMHFVYKTVKDGMEIVICSAPLGAPAATAILDWLICHGVNEIIAIGGCGTLTDIPENEMLISTAAVRDEGTSYHYLPPEREIELDKKAVTAVKHALDALGIRNEYVKTWTTDAFYRETKDMVNYRKSEGCTVVEMECSALAACARLREAVFGQILFTQDSLANVDMHDDRNWGTDSFDKAIAIALEAVCRI
ncbi:MAG: nucleoside phosphorylase [Oscillospiraceae bacterium]|nr:nucleoside phosphorylase [Oscillospiraceae bacterium]